MKPGTPTRDGDFGWPFGVNSFTEPHLLRPGECTFALNVRKDPFTAGWSHRPAFRHNAIKWASGEDANLWASGKYQAAAFEHKSLNVYALSGGRVFRFEPAGRGNFKGQCITPTRLLANNTEGWVTGVPGGAVVNDGRNLPLHCRGRSVVRVGTTRQDIRIGRSGIYMQGRFFYVTMDGKAILASDLNNPTSMQEAVDTNVYGWEAPDLADSISALNKHRVSANDVEIGNLAFSTDSDIYTIDVRGDRQSWGITAGRGRVSVAIPDVSFAGSRAAATVNANMVFMARQNNLNLCMLNQLASQFTRADAFSGQFLEANDWFQDAFRDKVVVQSSGSDVLVTAGPSIAKDGSVFHRYLLSFQAVKGTDEGLKFQGAWFGPRTIDILSAGMSGFLIVGVDDDGVTRFWTLAEGSVDSDHRGGYRSIHSVVETRGYDHKELFSPKTRGNQEVYFHDMCGPVDINVAHRLVPRGTWGNVRSKATSVNQEGTVGPISFGESDSINPTPGMPAKNFMVEQVLVSWTGNAILAGIASSAEFSGQYPEASDYGDSNFLAKEFDPLEPCVKVTPPTIPSEYL